MLTTFSGRADPLIDGQRENIARHSQMDRSLVNQRWTRPDTQMDLTHASRPPLCKSVGGSDQDAVSGRPVRRLANLIFAAPFPRDLSEQTLTLSYTVCLHRGGSRILQGRVSNPSERGTGGRASRAPREVGSGMGLCPLLRKFLYFVYQHGEFLCISGDIY